MAEPTVEEIELWLRKVARGDVPREGDVLLRANKSWIFSPALLDLGALRFDGDLAGGNVKPIGDADYVKFSGSNAIPPGEADIYEDIVEQGPGNIIEEDLANGELLFKAGGLYSVSGVVTYANLTQDSQLNMVLVRKGFVVIVASEQFVLSVADPFAVEIIQVTSFFKSGDRIYLTFGRIGGLNFTADIVNADLLAYVIALDRTL